MGIIFANRKEHALLAYVIKVAHEERQSERKTGGIGRTALQKIVYFLSVLGVPMQYRFSIHTYGPFCSGILSDAELLEFDEAILDSSKDQGNSSYGPGAQIELLLSGHQEFLKEYREKIEMVAKGLAPALPSTLELISTTDFVYRWLTTELARQPNREEVLARVEELKPSKFGSKDKNNAYDWLEKAGLMAIPVNA